MRKIILLIAILIGLYTGKTIAVPDCNMIIFAVGLVEGKETRLIFIMDNQRKEIGTIRQDDVLWIKYIPDNRAL